GGRAPGPGATSPRGPRGRRSGGCGRRALLEVHMPWKPRLMRVHAVANISRTKRARGESIVLSPDVLTRWRAGRKPPSDALRPRSTSPNDLSPRVSTGYYLEPPKLTHQDRRTT